jgi:hypothetical protein
MNGVVQTLLYMRTAVSFSSFILEHARLNRWGHDWPVRTVCPDGMV